MVIVEKRGGFNAMSTNNWTRMSLMDRVALIRDGKVQFLDDAGEVISKREATTLLATKQIA